MQSAFNHIERAVFQSISVIQFHACTRYILHASTPISLLQYPSMSMRCLGLEKIPLLPVFSRQKNLGPVRGGIFFYLIFI